MPTIVNLPPGVEAIVIISGLSFPRQTPSSSRTPRLYPGPDGAGRARSRHQIRTESGSIPTSMSLCEARGGRPRPLSLHTSAAECAPAPHIWSRVNSGRDRTTKSSAMRSMRIARPSSIALLPARRRNVTVSLICALEPVARREEMPDPRWSAGCKSPNALALPSRSAQPNDASIYVQNPLSPSVVLRPLKAPADDADLAQALHAEPVTVVRLLDEDHF